MHEGKQLKLIDSKTKCVHFNINKIGEQVSPKQIEMGSNWPQQQKEENKKIGEQVNPNKIIS